MRVYLAARYGEQAQMREWRALLETAGHSVTSRWINGQHDGAPPEQCATEDLEDIDAADVLVIWSPRHLFGNGRGGRHVEVGYALGKGMRIILVGERENVFHSLCDTAPDIVSAAHMLAAATPA